MHNLINSICKLADRHAFTGSSEVRTIPHEQVNSKIISDTENAEKLHDILSLAFNAHHPSLFQTPEDVHIRSGDTNSEYNRGEVNLIKKSNIEHFRRQDQPYKSLGFSNFTYNIGRWLQDLVKDKIQHSLKQGISLSPKHDEVMGTPSEKEYLDDLHRELEEIPRHFNKFSYMYLNSPNKWKDDQRKTWDDYLTKEKVSPDLIHILTGR